MNYFGEFETHLTVGQTDAEGLVRLQDFGKSRGLKCLHIILDQGQTTSQPMLTRRGHGDLQEQLQLARKVGQELNELGFHLNRIKLEAAPFNQGVPQSDQAATTVSPPLYFEHHLKLLLDANVDLQYLRELAMRHSAHVSRNALRVRADGLQERFVTQRFWSIGATSAHQHCVALTSELVARGLEVLETEEEFVVYDSNLELDAGWIAAPHALNRVHQPQGEVR